MKKKKPPLKRQNKTEITIPLAGAFEIDLGKSSRVECFFTSANDDFIAFCVLWRLHIIGNSGTYWLASHSIEKYIKARLLQIDPATDPQKYRHNLISLWEDLRKKDNFDDVANPEIYNKFIVDANRINMEVRYNESGSILSKQFFYLYCLLCTAIRLKILDHMPSKSKTNYGLGKIGLEDLPEGRCDAHRLFAKELVLDCLDNIILKNQVNDYLGQIETTPSCTEFVRFNMDYFKQQGD